MRATLSPPEVETLRQACTLPRHFMPCARLNGPQAHPLLSPLLRYFPGVLAALPPPHKPILHPPCPPHIRCLTLVTVIVPRLSY